ncbi:uncharacterized protein PRCAT00003912001 [Priceomyces carsonii]|uniref:uncharacterized protein n=1 Tax=Priceomyces carsonii TaxID=28549 RepID=UPI002EDA7382|nr:unnamed protein product [Priceomyces carsonii]
MASFTKTLSYKMSKLFDLSKLCFPQSSITNLSDRDSLELTEIIPRILIERSSFLNISEESLQKEIDNPKKGDDVKEDEQELGNEKSNIVDTATIETFQQQRQELARSIGSALNETSLSMDLVSLLISIASPNIGKSTISPHLSKNVPLGSLSLDRLQIEDSSEVTTPLKYSNEAKIGQGLKRNAISKVIVSFTDASERVREETSNEKQYWDMIIQVLSNDEVLFSTKDPLSGLRVVGIRYGYGDSGSSFHDKGLAILRQNGNTHEITFNPISSSTLKPMQKIYKYLRIKILSKIDDDYMVTGQSIFEKKFDQSKFKVINDIEKARFFLFEEDLFYHLIREAQLLISYNVSIISNKIIIELNNDIIELESIVYDENNEDELNNYYQNINEDSSKNNIRAQLMLKYMKLMLCCFYEYNLALRQKVPTAFTKWKQFNSHPLILRPFLGIIRHEGYLNRIGDMIKQTESEFKESVQIELINDKFVNLSKRTRNAFQKAVDIPLSVFDLTIKKLGSEECLNVKLEVTTSELFVNIILKLNITRFKSLDDLKTNINGTNVLQLNLNDINDLEDCLKWPIVNFINL